MDHLCSILVGGLRKHRRPYHVRAYPPVVQVDSHTAGSRTPDQSLLLYHLDMYDILYSQRANHLLAL